MDQEELIKQVSVLLAGLQVPVSMKMPLGAAEPAWVRLHRELFGFGWAKPEDYEAAIRKVLEAA